MPVGTRTTVVFFAIVIFAAVCAGWLSIAAWNDDAVHMRLWETQFQDGSSFLGKGLFRSAELTLRAAKAEVLHCRAALPALTLTSARIALAMKMRGHRSEAISELKSILPLMEMSCNAHPENSTLALQLINATNLLAQIYQEANQQSEAITTYRLNIKRIEAWPAIRSATMNSAYETAQTALKAFEPSSNKNVMVEGDNASNLYADGHRKLKDGLRDAALPILEKANLILKLRTKNNAASNLKLSEDNLAIRAAILVDLIDLYHSDGKLEQAARSAKQLSDLNALTMGATAPATLERLEQSADFLYHAGRFNKASERYRFVLNARKQLVDKSDSKRSVDLKRKLAQSLLQAGNTSDGWYELEQFLALNGGFGSSNPLAAQQLIEISHALDSAKMLPKGIPFFLQFFRERSDKDDGIRPVSALLTQLARALEMDGKHLEATTYRKRVIAAIERADGATSPKLRDPLESLAAEYMIGGKPELAIAPLQQELAMIKASPVSTVTRSLLARQYGMIAGAYLAQRKSARMIEYAQKALDLATEPRAAMTKADALGLLASAAAADGRKKDSYKYFNECLKQYEENLPRFAKDPDYQGFKARMAMYATSYARYKATAAGQLP